MEVLEGTLRSIKELDISNSHSDYLISSLNEKAKSEFLWGKLYLFLSQISSKQRNIEQEHVLASNLELFMIASDIIDDLMDKDNFNFNRLNEPVHFGITMIFETLFTLTHEIKGEDVKKTFLNNIKESLFYQYSDMSNTVCFGQDEEAYFSLSVKKSIYLVNAVEQLAFQEEELSIKTFSKYFAIASQISNDIKDVMKDDSYDLTNRKATLPIIKGIEAYTKYNNKENNNKINAYFFEKNDNLYEEIRLLIIESGSLEYSNFLVSEYYQKAYDSLCNCFPNSHKEINALFQYLRLRRDI
ncbi:polyprenyl synthetase family protein [Enterococcus sp. BWB1-3]|uniref:class 1 isoprenoid biosynthesis enzyme n=1 Tax=Enterococcus sp. BWB1-3 TaxID=2787713 RepID=UPI0019233106|nr:class 1 isoprenoid biosynthesis enzyme [Enterococcus sp. BWB1-3]MBL1231060.1 polyprenyl synthetase family protein [Enterococcus sp. BWB1-3]